MIYSTATVAVNSDGQTKLTREQAWAGLERKARDAREFLPAGLCTRCDVVEESATHFVREAVIGGAEIREIITLEPESKVTFFQATGPREGAIVNELFEDADGALQLRFYCYLGLRGSSRTGRRNRPSRCNSMPIRDIKPLCCRRSSARANCWRKAGFEGKVASDSQLHFEALSNRR